MIPKGSTPIKNEILTEIFAKGFLSYSEMRIVSYIIRWSWGFDGKTRRQDWTNPLSKYKIAKDINMEYSYCCRIIDNMISGKKLHSGKNYHSKVPYQFNEHTEEWIKEGGGKNYHSGKNSKKGVVKITTNSGKKLHIKPSKEQGDNAPETSKETTKETSTIPKKGKGDVLERLFSKVVIEWNTGVMRMGTGVMRKLLTTKEKNLIKEILETSFLKEKDILHSIREYFRIAELEGMTEYKFFPITTTILLFLEKGLVQKFNDKSYVERLENSE